MTAEPLITVVIPVYGVRGYLGQCLDSVLGQVPPDWPAGLQVIAVDDASPDDCGALLDERAAADGRLTVRHLPATAGPGNARNVGLADAAGRYVWFVDGDDQITAGSLTAIAAALAELGDPEPDLLLIDYQDRFADGGTGPSPGTAVLASAPSGVFTLADAPAMIDLTMTAWSKLFRREFLTALGEPFRPGIHEDIPVTCAALLTGRIAALNRVCYSYRRSRGGSFMATTSSAHLAVFDAYQEVFARLDKLAADGSPVVTPRVRRAVFERAIWHYSAVLQTTGTGFGPVGRPGLVPRRERRAFFERMHADFIRYAPDGYRPPPGARGAKFRLIQSGAYWAYEALEPVNRARVALRTALR